MAYCSMITLPVLIMFVAFQRAFVSSIASAGMKN
jgi:multiple sugar transport system permease protein